MRLNSRGWVTGNHLSRVPVTVDMGKLKWQGTGLLYYLPLPAFSHPRYDSDSDHFPGQYLSPHASFPFFIFKNILFVCFMVLKDSHIVKKQCQLEFPKLVLILI